MKPAVQRTTFLYKSADALEFRSKLAVSDQRSAGQAVELRLFGIDRLCGSGPRINCTCIIARLRRERTAHITDSSQEWNGDAYLVFGGELVPETAAAAGVFPTPIPSEAAAY